MLFIVLQEVVSIFDSADEILRCKLTSSTFLGTCGADCTTLPGDSRSLLSLWTKSLSATIQAIEKNFAVMSITLQMVIFNLVF